MNLQEKLQYIKKHLRGVDYKKNSGYAYQYNYTGIVYNYDYSAGNPERELKEAVEKYTRHRNYLDALLELDRCIDQNRLNKANVKYFYDFLDHPEVPYIKPIEYAVRTGYVIPPVPTKESIMEYAKKRVKAIEDWEEIEKWIKEL